MDLLFNSFLLLIVVFSPLIYGGITPFPSFIIQSISFSGAALFLVNIFFRRNIAIAKPGIIILGLFIGLILLQLLPLPQAVVNVLSWGSFLAYREFSFVSGWFYRLTVCPDSTVKMLLQVLSYFSVFFLAANTLDNESKIKRVLIVIIITGFLLSLYGIFFKLATIASGSNSFSTFVNRNHFAAYLEMIIPLAISLIFIIKRRPIRFILSFGVLAMFFALFLTSSRAGILSLFIAFVALFLLLRRKVNPTKLVVVFCSLLMLSLGILLWSDNNPAVNYTINKFKILNEPVKAYSGRLVFIKDSLVIIKDFPFLGTGLGTFGDIYQKYSTINEKSSSYLVRSDFAHNEPVQLLVETGLLGFVLLSVFLFTIFKSTVVLWRTRRNTFSVFLGAGCCVSLLAAFLHSLLDFTMHVPANALLFLIILAIFYRAVRIPSFASSQDRTPKLNLDLSFGMRVVLIITTIAGFIFIEVISFRRYKSAALLDISKGYSEEFEKPDKLKDLFIYKKNIGNINNAIGLNNLFSEPYVVKADYFRQAAVDEGLNKYLDIIGCGSSRQECLASAVSLYSQAINLNPLNAGYHFKLGETFEALGKMDKALARYEAAQKLFPSNFRIGKYIAEFMQ